MCGESARIWFRSSVGEPVPVELPILGGQAIRVCGPLLGLRMEVRRARQNLLEQLRCELTGPLVHDACVVLGADQEGTLSGDGARVELRRRPVNRDPGLVVPRHDRPLDRGRAAPAGKQRRMDVEPVRAVEEALGDERAVGDHDDCVRRLERERLVQSLGLSDGDPEPFRGLLGRWRADLPPSASRSVGPGQEVGDLVMFGKPFEHVCAQRRGCRDRKLH